MDGFNRGGGGGGDGVMPRDRTRWQHCISRHGTIERRPPSSVCEWKADLSRSHIAVHPYIYIHPYRARWAGGTSRYYSFDSGS